MIRQADLCSASIHIDATTGLFQTLKSDDEAGVHRAWYWAMGRVST